MSNRPTLAITVMGPIEVRRGGVLMDHPDLRRQRVRELLCSLIAHGRVRREQVAEELWPHLHDSARNLQVTLSYLQRVLEPDRQPDQRPSYVRSDSVWLELTTGDHLTVDVWDLDAALATARHSIDDDSTAAALSRLTLWRGEPYASGRFVDARTAAHHAIDADPCTDPAYHLLARTHLADGDTVGARRAIAAFRQEFDRSASELVAPSAT